MPSYVLRVWIPDRPGALGAVASRIGAVRGDVVAIEILERGAGRAIDELVVVLPDEALVPLLVEEVGEVDGVDVEDIRGVADLPPDPRLDALETAAVVVEQQSVATLLVTLVSHARHDFEADWAVVVSPGGSHPLAVVGDPPPTPWLGALVTGADSSAPVRAGVTGPDDVAWASMPKGALVVGRGGRPFRSRERHQLAALGRIAALRWDELSRVDHPSLRSVPEPG